MTGFTLHLQSGSQYSQVENVESFTGIDASGSFGILAGHERMMTVLEFGLASYRTGDAETSYIALPGGILHFSDNELRLCVHRYFVSPDYEAVVSELTGVFRKEAELRHDLHKSVSTMERELTRRMWDLQRERG